MERRRERAKMPDVSLREYEELNTQFEDAMTEIGRLRKRLDRSANVKRIRVLRRALVLACRSIREAGDEIPLRIELGTTEKQVAWFIEQATAEFEAEKGGKV